MQVGIAENVSKVRGQGLDHSECCNNRGMHIIGMASKFTCFGGFYDMLSSDLKISSICNEVFVSRRYFRMLMLFLQ